jgi:serine/threonine protein kinase
MQFKRKSVLKPLLDEHSIKRFSFSLREKQIGQGRFGEVFLAKLFFNAGSAKKVAVKFFKPDFFLSESLASKYNSVIIELIRAGVKLPKMRAIKLKLKSKMTAEDFKKKVIPINDLIVPFNYKERLKKGEWVLVSQFFGSSIGKKCLIKLVYSLLMNLLKLRL